MHLKQCFMQKFVTIILAASMLMTAPLTIAAAESPDERPVASVAAAAGKLSPTLFAEEDIRNSNTTITITLTGATWKATAFTLSSSVATFMKGFVPASQAAQWKLVQSAKNINIVHVDSSTLRLVLPPIPAYDITYNQTISVTIPKSFIDGGTSDIYAGSFTIKCDTAPYSISLEDALRTGTLAYWLKYTSPYDVLISVPQRHVDTITVSQQQLGNTYITIVDITTTDNVASVSVTWNNITNSTHDYISSGYYTRTFSVASADIPPGADITIRAKDKYDAPVQKDIVKKVKTGQTTYNELPKSPLYGWYTLYSLITDSKLLDSVLSYYSISELETGVR